MTYVYICISIPMLKVSAQLITTWRYVAVGLCHKYSTEGMLFGERARGGNMIRTIMLLYSNGQYTRAAFG